MAQHSLNPEPSPPAPEHKAENRPALSGSSDFSVKALLDLLRTGNTALVSMLLFVLVFWVFLPSVHNGFIGVDDAGYISENVHVRDGFSWAGIGWAFTNSLGGSWHPLTWFSIMLDCQIFGVHPAGHHLTDLLLHAANSVLLFLVFRRMTGAPWRSAGVAVLFALHPVHVESVAWASERKDVLSTFFWMLTLLLYARYVAAAGGPKAQRPKAKVFYGVTLLFFACGLMSKPMVVTLPLILLLIDWWPLRRFELSTSAPGWWPLGRFQPPTPGPQASALFREKLPFFALGFLISALTVYSQREFGALSGLSDLSIPDRIINATLSYFRYVQMMVWPAGLAQYYPLPTVFPIWPAAWVALLLLLASALVLRAARTQPYLAFGWIWYLVTLLPVIGLIQAGHQSHADRYTYIPLIGLFLLLVWGIHDLSLRLRYQPLILSTLALAVIIPCIALTRRQIRYWKDSETLFRHALAVTKNNEFAHDILGTTLIQKGQLDEGIPHLQAALKLAPNYARAHNDLGAALGQKGREDEAVGHFQEALRLNPRFAEAHRNLGLALDKQGRLDEAIGHLQAAVRLKSDFAEAYRDLGSTLGKQGRLAEAVESLTEAVRLAPGDAETHCCLGITLGKLGRLDEAMSHLEEALKLNPNSAEAHCNLGVALGAKGQLDDAIGHLQKAIELKPGYTDARNNLRTALDLKSGSGNQPGAPAKP